MPPILRYITLMLFGMLCMAGGPARQTQSLQPLQQRGFEPVESRVDDLDPTATSLREVRAGLAVDGGQETYIYRRRQQGETDRLYYIAPGVVAEFDRSEYLLIEHRRRQYIFHAIPAGTVFHLGLPQPPASRQPQVEPPLRIQRRLDPNGPNQRPAEGHTTPRTPAVDWDAYARHRQAQHAAVLDTIDRLADADRPTP